MFGLLKKKSYSIGAPVKGRAVPISQVNDPTFAGEILGKGVAICPEDGNIYAPADGRLELVFDTRHAVSMNTKDGVEVLIHVGLETVKLKGEHFTAHKKNGDKVLKGDLLLTVDLKALKADGYDTITSVVICNSSQYEKVEAHTGVNVQAGEEILALWAQATSK